MNQTVHSTSPGGRYQLRVETWEPLATLWVNTPEVVDLALGVSVLRFRDERWSLDWAAWETPARLCMTLRKFPGNHRPASLTAWADFERGQGWLNNSLFLPLDQLEGLLEAALAWN